MILGEWLAGLMARRDVIVGTVILRFRGLVWINHANLLINSVNLVPSILLLLQVNA